jgi:hypothetical protein
MIAGPVRQRGSEPGSAESRDVSNVLRSAITARIIASNATDVGTDLGRSRGSPVVSRKR